jgi:hypothetical protein
MTTKVRGIGPVRVKDKTPPVMFVYICPTLVPLGRVPPGAQAMEHWERIEDDPYHGCCDCVFSVPVQDLEADRLCEEVEELCSPHGDRFAIR